jgi:D-lactate dehydrogenase
MSTTVAVYDTKPYDRRSLANADDAKMKDWRFLDFRLELDTAEAASGAQVVCVFVNDDAGRAVLEKLVGIGVRLLALRCTGFNNVDLLAAKEMGLPVTRLPNYSPYAVAEHTIALILALNRKLHRSFNRVREFNFSLTGLEGFDLHGKTAGIFGTDKTGRIVAEILRGVRHACAGHGVVYAEKETLARESDVLLRHVRTCVKKGSFLDTSRNTFG